MTGLCQCGCGQPAPIATITKNSIGQRKGQPMRYIANHQPRPGRPINVPTDVVAQFVEPSDPSACWPWQGTLAVNGYGVVGVNGRQHKAHRVAYEIANGPIPMGMVVRHACDNPPCCNPAHLLIGTHRDNNDDKIRRRRHAFGERAYQARLTEKDVLEIRSRRSAGESVSAMAREYGVSVSAAGHAAAGRSWKHLGSAS